MAGKTRLVIKDAARKQFLLSIVAANGQKILTSETYKRKAGATNAAEVAKKAFINAIIEDKTASSKKKKSK